MQLFYTPLAAANFLWVLYYHVTGDGLRVYHSL